MPSPEGEITTSQIWQRTDETEIKEAVEQECNCEDSCDECKD